MNDILDKLYDYLDRNTASAELPYYRREAKLQSIMGKLKKDIDKYDIYGEQIAALSVHLLLANEYDLFTLKETRVLLDYILGQTSNDIEVS